LSRPKAFFGASRLDRFPDPICPSFSNCISIISFFHSRPTKIHPSLVRTSCGFLASVDQPSPSCSHSVSPSALFPRPTSGLLIFPSTSSVRGDIHWISRLCLSVTPGTSISIWYASFVSRISVLGVQDKSLGSPPAWEDLSRW
jgi:hypothetical protein